MLTGKSILVTGGTGSFGQAFIHHIIANYHPARVAVFSRDELKQYEMQCDPRFDAAPVLRYFIGDVRDERRLEMAMRGVDYVIHAAALKHVPAAEYNPFECIHTNVLGAENVVNAAIRAGVQRVVALSTDKAASPLNLYGASKLASDKIFVAANNLSGAGGTAFSVVRYGNVVGSRGSVVPFFRKLIRGGATSLPITDPRMTRFWITLEQGINFVLACLERMEGGEVFVPKIPSMKIVDLARVMAPGLAQHVIGVRPGEKIHEVMITEDDARTVKEFPDGFIIEPAFPFWTDQGYSHADARPVPENFHYASDSNPHWLTDEALRVFLRDLYPND